MVPSPSTLPICTSVPSRSSSTVTALLETGIAGRAGTGTAGAGAGAAGPGGTPTAGPSAAPTAKAGEVVVATRSLPSYSSSAEEPMSVPSTEPEPR